MVYYHIPKPSCSLHNPKYSLPWKERTEALAVMRAKKPGRPSGLIFTGTVLCACEGRL